MKNGSVKRWTKKEACSGKAGPLAAVSFQRKRGVSGDEVAVGDCDGVIFLPYDKLDEIVPVAEAIRDTEKSRRMPWHREKACGNSSNSRNIWRNMRKITPGFREHLRKIGGAVEE